ncbi:MAG TPA: DUF2213 domain-containing protein [Kofleriaceae bacterium]|jgi:hypothetical protein
MTRQIRLDAPLSALDAPVKNPDGSVTYTSRVASTGPLRYMQPDGSFTVERRNLDELRGIARQINAKSIPVTLNHPDDGMFSSGSRHPIAGRAHDARIERDDGVDHVVAKLTVRDPMTIGAIADKTHRGVSLGYSCDTEDAGDGTWLQKNVQVDHAACVPTPRCTSCFTRSDGACPIHRDWVAPLEAHAKAIADPDDDIDSWNPNAGLLCDSDCRDETFEDDDPENEIELDGGFTKTPPGREPVGGISGLMVDAPVAEPTKNYSAPDPNTPPAVNSGMSEDSTMSDKKTDCGCQNHDADAARNDAVDYDLDGNPTAEHRRRRDRAMLGQPSVHRDRGGAASLDAGAPKQTTDEADSIAFMQRAAASELNQKSDARVRYEAAAAARKAGR